MTGHSFAKIAGCAAFILSSLAWEQAMAGSYGQRPDMVPGTAAGSPTDARAAGEAPSCTDALVFEADARSFDRGAPSPSPSPEQVAQLRAQAEQLFRSTVDAMCAGGEVDPAHLRGIRRILVQHGAGATETLLYADAVTFGRDTWVFQYAFDRGEARPELAPPPAGDLREGLLCWITRDEAYRRRCEEERRP